MHEFPTILHAIASHARTIPEKVAIIEAENDRQCTYGELWAYIKSFSQRLITAGVKRDFGDGYGTRITGRCTQTVDFVVTMLAVQLAGGVFVPVEKNIADARIIEIMEETDSTILIAIKPLSDYNCTYIPLADATSQSNEIDDNDIVFPTSDALASILFTTGTTGKSKGVMYSYKSFVLRAVQIFSIINDRNEQVWLIPNPISHINAGLRMSTSLLFESTFVLLDGYLFSKIYFSAVSKYKVTILNMLSAPLEMYLQTCRENLVEIRGQIKYLSLASSSFSEKQITSLRDIFSASGIIQTYGSNEAGICVIDHSQQKYPAFCVGQPVSGAKVVFFNEEKTNIIEATSKNPGLFAFNNESDMLGYWKNPELTASVTRENYIILSDLGYKGTDGLYYFLGRADDIIISSAYKISPLEIEDVANSFEGIRESACVPVNDPIRGQVPKLYVVMNEGYIFNFTEINIYLKSKLEASRVPRYIEELEELPKVGNKINRKELRDK